VSDRPNIVYMHSHDTGRYVQPYGYSIPTPNIQRLADQGILFRKAFCAAPTCSASRACLLTGQYGHTNGMLGLAHRGWSLNDYTHHIVHTLRDRGYHSALIGDQHISKKPDVIGYDEVVRIDTNHADQIAPAAEEFLSRQGEEPFFLSVGFLRDPPRVPRPEVGARPALRAAAAQPPRRPGDPSRHGRLPSQRTRARPGRGRGARLARGLRPVRADPDRLHHRSRNPLSGRQGHPLRPRPR
jgi:arylsulfatase A-like enzyme